jgi:hypothetical protein
MERIEDRKTANITLNNFSYCSFFAMRIQMQTLSAPKNALFVVADRVRVCNSLVVSILLVFCSSKIRALAGY